MPNTQIDSCLQGASSQKREFGIWRTLHLKPIAKPQPTIPKPEPKPRVFKKNPEASQAYSQPSEKAK